METRERKLKREKTEADVEQERGRVFAEARTEEERRLQKFGILAPTGVINRDLRRQIWRDIIIKERWTAEYAQLVARGDIEVRDKIVFKSGDDRAETERKRGIFDVADVLAHDDDLWKRWWMDDFALFAQDIGTELPDWILKNPKETGMGNFQHRGLLPGATEVERRAIPPRIADQYINVPWRRYYAWCQFFQRRCAKLIIALAEQRARRYELPVFTYGVQVSEEVRATDWHIDDENPNKVVIEFDDAPRWADARHNPTLNQLTGIAGAQIGSPLIAWYFLFQEGHITANTTLEVLIGTVEFISSIARFHEEWVMNPDEPLESRWQMVQYRFNFDNVSEAMVTFMTWYDTVYRENMMKLGKIMNPQLPRGSRIIREVFDRDDKRQWLTLNRLPIIPTRDEIRFIGDNVQLSPIECGHCGANAKLLTVRCGHCKHTGYCSKVCQGKHWDKHKMECK